MEWSVCPKNGRRRIWKTRENPKRMATQLKARAISCQLQILMKTCELQTNTTTVYRILLTLQSTVKSLEVMNGNRWGYLSTTGKYRLAVKSPNLATCLVSRLNSILSSLSPIQIFASAYIVVLLIYFWILYYSYILSKFISHDYSSRCHKWLYSTHDCMMDCPRLFILFLVVSDKLKSKRKFAEQLHQHLMMRQSSAHLSDEQNIMYHYKATGDSRRHVGSTIFASLGIARYVLFLRLFHNKG